MAEPTENSTIKHIEVEGYEFDVDTDLLDDVQALDIIHQIEDKQRVSAIVPLLHFLIGDTEYAKLEAHFIKADAEAHKEQDGYRARFRASKLTTLYNAIIKHFDPKG